MRIARTALMLAVGFGLLAQAVQPALACPFCSAPSLTLTEQVDQADAVVLAEWTSAKKAEDPKETGSTAYTIKQVVKGGSESIKAGEKITLARYRVGKPGDLFLLMGTSGTSIEWGSPLEVSESSFNYLAQSPAPGLPTQKRLVYFLKYLEFPDELVANDAYAEFANAPYKDIAPLADRMPRERIRKWVASDETPVTRLGLYGLLLGLCGTKEDAALMEKKITAPTEDFRLGIDGVMSGYLLLTGKEGLKLIEETKLKADSKKVPFSETYAAMQALRFLWTYGDGVVSQERLRESMRILLDRPELADLVIADLARWKDWAVQDRLMELYGAEDYNIPSIKRAIVRYMLVSAKDSGDSEESAEPGAEPPAHVAQAKANLEKLRKQDPKTVREAERFFFLR